MNQKELLIISVTIFLTVIAWIIADLVHVSTTQQVKVTNPNLKENITVQVDIDTIQKLKQKR